MVGEGVIVVLFGEGGICAGFPPYLVFSLALDFLVFRRGSGLMSWVFACSILFPEFLFLLWFCI